MIALARFQLTGYLRSLRVLHPLIAVALLMTLVLLDQPDSESLIVGAYGDTAAFLFPIWAWSARALLDTQPDGQRELSALTMAHRTTPALAGLLAAYLLNLALATLVLAPPVIKGLSANVDSGAIAAAIALNLLAALAATLLGAWTSRAVIPSQAISILTLLCGCVLLLILSMGPLSWASVPMTQWLRAAHHGPTAFTAAFPGLAAHLAAWSAAATTAYLLVRRHRSQPA